MLKSGLGYPYNASEEFMYLLLNLRIIDRSENSIRKFSRVLLPGRWLTEAQLDEISKHSH